MRYSPSWSKNVRYIHWQYHSYTRNIQTNFRTIYCHVQTTRVLALVHRRRYGRIRIYRSRVQYERFSVRVSTIPSKRDSEVCIEETAFIKWNALFFQEASAEENDFEDNEDGENGIDETEADDGANEEHWKNTFQKRQKLPTIGFLIMYSKSCIRYGAHRYCSRFALIN